MKKKLIWLATVIVVAGMLFGVYNMLQEENSQSESPAWTFQVAWDYPLAVSLKQMTDESDFVVIGTYEKLDSTWNMARNPDNILEEDDEYRTEGHLYVFQVEEVLKGNLESGEILVNHKYSQTFPVRSAVTGTEGEIEVEDPRYIEPQIGGEYILFLDSDTDFGRFYGAAEPFMIQVLPDGAAQLKSNLIGHSGAFVQSQTFGDGEQVRVEVAAAQLTDTISGLSLEQICQQIEQYSGEPPVQGR